MDKWKLHVRNSIFEEDQIRLQNIQNEIRRHIISRIKASSFILKNFDKSLKKKIKIEAFKIITNYNDIKIKKKNSRSQSISNNILTAKISKHINFIGSGKNEDISLKGSINFCLNNF